MCKPISTLKDDFHNTARIYTHNGPAYYKGPITLGYRLVISADYDRNTVYHVSMHETLADALSVLSGLSCGTFKTKE